MYLFLLMHNVLQLRMCHWLFVLIVLLLFYILLSTCFHILVFFLIMLLPYNGNVYFLMLIQLHNAVCLPIIQWTETPGVVSFSLSELSDYVLWPLITITLIITKEVIQDYIIRCFHCFSLNFYVINQFFHVLNIPIDI